MRTGTGATPGAAGGRRPGPGCALRRDAGEPCSLWRWMLSRFTSLDTPALQTPVPCRGRRGLHGSGTNI